MSYSRPLTRLGLGVALTAIAATILALVALDRSPRQNPNIGSHGKAITTVRTLLVAASGPVDISVPGQPLRAILVSGSMPSMPSMATVLSDENCAPDAQGVSHCTNRLRMEDGSHLTVTHPHRMATVPCLAPGERIALQKA